MTENLGQEGNSTKLLYTKERLSPNTWVPLGAVVAIVLSLVGGTWFVAQRWAILETTLNHLDNRLNNVDNRLNNIESQLELLRGSHSQLWSAKDFSVWVERFQEMNPEIRVPRVQ